MSVQQACSSRSFVPVSFMVLLPWTQHSKQLPEVNISSTCSKRKSWKHEFWTTGDQVPNDRSQLDNFEKHMKPVKATHDRNIRNQSGRKHQLEGTKCWKSNVETDLLHSFAPCAGKPKPPGRSTGKCLHCEPSSVGHLQCGTSPSVRILVTGHPQKTSKNKATGHFQAAFSNSTKQLQYAPCSLCKKCKVDEAALFHTISMHIRSISMLYPSIITP